MGNLPILYQNIMLGLPSEFACDAFLWAVERPGEDRNCYRAEAFARGAHYLVSVLGHLIKLQQYSVVEAARRGMCGRVLDQEQADSLVSFCLTRHANWEYGGNQKPTYCGGHP